MQNTPNFDMKIPELSLVLLVGTSSSGKSTFAAQHFKATEVISSDYCRALVSDDENSMEATTDAFELLHFIVEKRLKRGKLTVVDATNIQPESRRPLIDLAKRYYAIPVAIVFEINERICQDRNLARTDRELPKYVIRNQRIQMKKGLRSIKSEGFRYLYRLKSVDKVAQARVEITQLWSNKKELKGPFDVIGDVHGCFDELHALLEKMGYQIQRTGSRAEHFGFRVQAPEGRTALFLGDLCDRGPNTPDCLGLAMSMVQDGIALCVPGNHEDKLKRALMGKNVQRKHGLKESMEQLEKEPEAFREAIVSFIDSLISHYVLDEGKLVIAHAGLREDMQGRASGKVRSFCLYGETTGEIDSFGLPVRYDWARDYEGKARVVYGHTPVPEATWYNRTIDIDTGCVFGGKLTALHYPEMTLESVPAHHTYAEPGKPVEGRQEVFVEDHLPDISTVQGKRIISTRLRDNLTIREENSIAALEVMSRFALDPRWLIYLPPTMSPSETSQREGYLEYPEEAFDHYLSAGVEQVVCQEKHMGSRAVVVVCRDETTARERFGVAGGKLGACYTRTGRPFFKDSPEEDELLQAVSGALSASGFWEKFQTGWVCLDCELMPWSAKAQSLIRDQYAAVGAAAEAVFPEIAKVLEQAKGRGLDLKELPGRMQDRHERVSRYRNAYRQYCWPVNSLSDYRLAPFHIMATEGAVHIDKDHLWHMQEIEAICEKSPELMFRTQYRQVDLRSEEARAAATQWWLDLTEKGGEGMVIKPLDFLSRKGNGLVQPALKCRGREYLRIIYGPDYDLPENLDRLRKRGLNRKRSLALREFALGVEALERFVNRQPFKSMHECVFAVLALESEPVDPRL